jgi:hypothetical protein
VNGGNPLELGEQRLRLLPVPLGQQQLGLGREPHGDQLRLARLPRCRGQRHADDFLLPLPALEQQSQPHRT